MGKEKPRYLAYLIRLWQVEGDTVAKWRASVEDPHSGERKGFADLTGLFAFLEEQIADTGRDRPAPEDKGD